MYTYSQPSQQGVQPTVLTYTGATTPAQTATQGTPVTPYTAYLQQQPQQKHQQFTAQQYAGYSGLQSPQQVGALLRAAHRPMQHASYTHIFTYNK